MNIAVIAVYVDMVKYLLSISYSKRTCMVEIESSTTGDENTSSETKGRISGLM